MTRIAHFLADAVLTALALWSLAHILGVLPWSP